MSLEQLLARGEKALVAGEFARALADFTDATKLAPKEPVAWCARSAAFFGLGDDKNALAAAKRALLLAPRDPRVHHVLAPPSYILNDAEGVAASAAMLTRLDKAAARNLALFWVAHLSEREYFEEAAEAFGLFAARHEDDAIITSQHVILLLNAFQLDEAERVLDKAQANAAAFPGYDALVARVLLGRGDIDGARKAALRAIAADRRAVSAYTILSETDPAAIDASMSATLRDVADDPSAAADWRVMSGLALGRALEDRKDFDGAFSAFAAAKEKAKAALAGAGQRYDRAATQAVMRREIAAYPAPLGAPVEGPPPALLFIIGMPRSGSTLIDQVLSRHSAVASVGESQLTPRLHKAIARDARAGGRDISAAAAARAGDFKAAYRDASSGKPFVVDKNLSNYWRGGLIATMDPGARFILSLREPADIALSLYRTNFMAAHPWSNDFDDIAHMIACFEVLTDHWRRALGERLHVVRHETFSADFDGGVRALLEFCGLAFEPDCLEFYKGDRPVFTQSAAQVRKPLNNEGAARGRAYERHLDGFRRSLDEWRRRLRDNP